MKKYHELTKTQQYKANEIFIQDAYQSLLCGSLRFKNKAIQNKIDNYLSDINTEKQIYLDIDIAEHVRAQAIKDAKEHMYVNTACKFIYEPEV